jgi:hypothetical protein
MVLCAYVFPSATCAPSSNSWWMCVVVQETERFHLLISKHKIFFLFKHIKKKINNKNQCSHSPIRFTFFLFSGNVWDCQHEIYQTNYNDKVFVFGQRNKNGMRRDWRREKRFCRSKWQQIKTSRMMIIELFCLNLLRRTCFKSQVK